MKEPDWKPIAEGYMTLLSVPPPYQEKAKEILRNQFSICFHLGATAGIDACQAIIKKPLR